MPIIEITEENFETIVMQSEQPVLLDFWAPWCGPCRMVSPLIDQIADENPDVLVGKVNVDEQEALAARYEIMSIPTLLVMQNGTVTEKMVGAHPKAQIIAMLRR